MEMIHRNGSVPPIFCFLAMAWLLAVDCASAGLVRELTVPGFSCGEGAYAVRLPKSLHELRRVAKLDAEWAPRKAPDWMNYRILRFPGLEAGIFINSTDRYVMEYVRITSPDWHVAGHLRVGMPATTFLGSQGLAASSSDGIWKIWNPGPDAAWINVKAGEIRQILYNCYAG